ncbi:MAG: DUF5667 domain-containing protein [Bacillota bacterium]
MKKRAVFVASALALTLTMAVPLTALADATAPAATTPTAPEAVTASAQTTAAPAPQTADAGLLPGGPLYFLDRLVESVQLFLTRSPEARVDLYVRFADERLAEMKLVASQPSGDGLQQQAATQALASDVLETLSRAGAGLEALKLENGDLKVAAKVQAVAQEGESVLRTNRVLPGAVTPHMLQQVNEILQTVAAITSVNADAVAQARDSGVQPGRLALTVKMAQTSGKDVSTVAGLMKTASDPAQVAQQLGLDPNTFTKLEIKVSGSEVKVEAAGSAAAAQPTAAAAGWNGQIALPGDVAQVLDYKYEARDGKVEYQVTYVDASGRIVTYKYESKDGKVETRLEVHAQGGKMLPSGQAARLYGQPARAFAPGQVKKEKEKDGKDQQSPSERDDQDHEEVDD